MTNFDFLLSDERFSDFANVAVTAEKVLAIDIASSVINSRKAMEFAVKWMYSVDSCLIMPYEDKLVTLINTTSFKDIVGTDMYKRINFIRLSGNNAVHTSRKITKEQAELCLENLFVFLDFIDYCYGDISAYKEKAFNTLLLYKSEQKPNNTPDSIDFERLMAENQALRDELTIQRETREQTYVTKPLELSEFKTRKIYIDTMLIDAGWTQGKDWINEFELTGMPNKAEKGYADYVLFGDDGKPLALIEAKRTCVDVAKGRQQAKLYADLIENKYKRRPIIFLSNGFETRIWNDKFYPERKVSGIYAKRDLEKEFNKLSMRTPLSYIKVNDDIANRYYQKEAIRAVCDCFDKKNRRKALLVMATGSGKTRTVISLVDVLLNHGWIKNILFLADRNSLVTQAKRAFVNLLPDLSVANLCEDKDNLNARGIFSTYQTMMNAIDDAKDEQGGKLFTCGHFDLIIVDEAHRSIYNKYKDIFTYFDAYLVGLTATPKDEIDRNTYGIFELENGVPTYGYELAQAVKDGFLVDFVSIETKLKFLEEGIVYDELSEDEKEEYEELFVDENGDIPERISSSALNEWIFNDDTIKEVLNTLLKDGIKINYGETLGKTIIFAKSHKHAEKIYEVFGKEYPNYPPNFCRVIDNYTNYVQSLIDEFSSADKLPHVAISVDMMDTGIDVPECVNLVFFKKVLSKSKFWQMIGRGTRLCLGLIDGQDKKQFYIFDFCGNFEFFRVKKNGKESISTATLQEKTFNQKTEIVFKLQGLEYQTEDLTAFRTELLNDLVRKVQELNRENFAVKQHIKYVELYSDVKSYEALSYENTLQMAEEIAPLILPDEDEINALRFDALMYGIELAYIVGKTYSKARKDLFTKVNAIAKVSTIPEVTAQKEFISKILTTDFVENAGINEFEIIREKIRDLIKYIPSSERHTYQTNFTDDILSVEWNEADLSNDDLKNYKAKAAHYIRQHQNEEVITKLKTNIPLSSEDIQKLESILWSKVGTKQDYQNEIGEKPLGVFVREIIGLDMVAAKMAFSKYLNEVSFDSRQIYFVNQIIEYIVQNGTMSDFAVLQQSPFTDKGSIVEIFDDVSVWSEIKQVIDSINNACVA